MESKDLQEEFLRKFSEHIPETQSQTVLILKAHLLIEEMLWAYLKHSVFFPEQLKGSRLQFGQLACLVSALHADRRMEWLWKAIRKLNKMRNELAHNLEPKGFDGLANDFIIFFTE